MRINITKTLFIFLLLVCLSGCGRQESEISGDDAAAGIKSGGETSAEVEITELPESQYPLIATPSTMQWIDLLLVSEGMYCIFDGEKYGFMTEAGEEITSCIYDTAEPFNEGLACVSQGGKYGYIDAKGEVALPLNYDYATAFVEGLAYFEIGERYGFMDQTGTPVFYPDCDSVSSFQEGLAFFSKDGRYGYIDQAGQIVIDSVYDDAGYFEEGLAKVVKSGRTGVINRKGELIVDVKYDYVTINDSFIFAVCDGKMTCLDRTGEIIVEQSDNIRVTGEYLCFQEGQKTGLLDKEGNLLIEPVYDQIWSLGEKLFQIKEGELWGVADCSGNVRIPAVYSSVFYDKYANHAEGGMLVLKDADGNMECVDSLDLSKKISCQYDSIDWMDRERAIVRQNGRFGIIDGEGKLIEPLGYDVIQGFDNGVVWMQRDLKSWFVNSIGEMIEIGDDIDNISKTGDLYQIEKYGKYGFINEQGEEVVSPVYSYPLNYEVYGCSNIYILTDYNSEIRNSVIRTGEPENIYIMEALLHNEITPRSALYHEFVKSGSMHFDDFMPDGYTASQEDLKDCKKTYRLYDTDHTGEVILYVMAQPYVRNNFPESYSGFYAIGDSQIVELVTGYECGGSMRGDYACLWYDRETSRVFPGTNGFWGGFGGYASAGTVYEKEGAGLKIAADFGWTSQPVSYFSDEDLACAELVYDADEQPYTKEKLAQADQEIAQIYRVNQEQVTLEKYQAMEDRYQMLYLPD